MGTIATTASFDQRTGRFTIASPVDDGGIERVIYEATGYAGRGRHRNDPESQHLRGLGPLPRGAYDVVGSVDHVRFGPVVFRLSPVEGNSMFGRSGFLIHGDSTTRPGDASSGCIVLPRAARYAVGYHNVGRLVVYASAPSGRPQGEAVVDFAS